MTKSKENLQLWNLKILFHIYKNIVSFMPSFQDFKMKQCY